MRRRRMLGRAASRRRRSRDAPSLQAALTRLRELRLGPAVAQSVRALPARPVPSPRCLSADARARQSRPRPWRPRMEHRDVQQVFTGAQLHESLGYQLARPKRMSATKLELRVSAIDLRDELHEVQLLTKLDGAVEMRGRLGRTGRARDRGGRPHSRSAAPASVQADGHPVLAIALRVHPSDPAAADRRRR